MKTRLKMSRLRPLLLLAVVVVFFPAESSAQCFGGVLTMEKIVGVGFSEESQPLLNKQEAAVINECNSICKNLQRCRAFSVDFQSSSCVSYELNSEGRRRSLVPRQGSNYFEKICLRGVNYNRICGQERLWAFERVLDAYLRGHDNKTIPNVDNHAECLKLCLNEEEFLCRSAEYDTNRRVCRLSREDRRTKPVDFVSDPGSLVDYMENQCARMLPDCRYSIQKDAMVVSMDALVFANIQSDCESLCDKSRIMTCRSYSFDPSANRCYLSGDDSVSLNQTVLPFKQGVVTGEKQCTVSQCERDQGTIIYEKITGNTVRTARETLYQLDTSPGGITEKCGRLCMEDSGECPAFAVDYSNNRCFMLDRNTQGRSLDIMRSTGKSYFEKVCVRATLPARCRDSTWHFERVPGMELRGLDDKQMSLVQSRRDCIEACLQETNFLCRSAEYDSSALLCRLSRSDRRSSPSNYVTASANTVEYLENQCAPVDDTCLYRKTDGAYPLYLDDTIEPVVSEEQCQRACTLYSKFNCRSLSYFPTGSQCFISGDDTVSGGGREALQNRPGTTYFERDCTYTGPGTTDPGITTTDGGGGGGGIPTTTRPGGGRPTTDRPDGGGGGGGGVERCRFGRLTFEKVTGYELSGIRSNILYSSNNPGITARCSSLCKNRRDCMAFNLDYNRFECYSLDTRASEAPQNLRQSSGVAYFEGICLRSGGCGLQWTFERVPNFELKGRARETLNGISKSECMERCLEERRFTCRSATYEYSRKSCLLSDHDRFSALSSFQAAPNVDYMENQCAPAARGCSYTNNQNDRYLIYTTKTTTAFTDATCRRACDTETEFNCRAYSFMSASNSNTDQCYLSSDTGTNAGNNAFQFRSGALFAEKKCTEYTGGGDGTSDGVLNCRFAVTYDKVMGVDLRGSRDEIRARDPLGITIECLQECDRQLGRCLALTLETSPSNAQRCYALERAAGNDYGALLPASEVSYFEKVCIPERGCGKAWTFVRVHGYDLDVNGRIINNVLTRQECQAECLRATNIPCRSAVYNTREGTCKLMAETRRTDPDKFAFKSRNYEFMENQCAPDPPNCDYANYEGRFLPYFDRFFTNVFDQTECKQYCDNERDFTCRSYNFQSFRRECSLSSDDTFTVGGQNALKIERDYFYSEKGACKTVRVDCTQTYMLVTFTFGTPFEGRVYATGNPQVCHEMGNRQTQVVLRVLLGSKCGTREESEGKYVNTVVVQQHPLIMQESDRTVRVECSFEAGDQTVSFAPEADSGRTGGGIDINAEHEVVTNFITGFEKRFSNVTSAQFRPGENDVISNTAPTPTVRMRIYKASGQEANNVDLGELLTLKIEMEQSSAFAIFARNLEARTDNGDLMTLIDNIGCPRYPNIFPELQLEEGTKSLYGDFKAFRFPSTARVNFVATVRFCQDRCDPVSCGGGVVSYGRRRRRRSVGNTTVSFEDDDIFDEDEFEVTEAVHLEMSADGTTENTFTVSLGPTNATVVNIPGDTARTTKRSVSSTTSRSTRSTAFTTTTTTTGVSTTGVSTTTTTTAATLNASPQEDTEEGEDPAEMPGDIPLSLSLVVGEDIIPEDRQRHRYRDETYVADDYVCTPTSTVIAAVLTLLVLVSAAAAGFVFFYRSKKRHWQKMGSCDPFPLPPQPKSQFYNSPEVMFRAAYGGFPGQSSLATNMAAFSTAQALSPMHEDSPQYKE